jgi:hypothetical protein
MKDGFGCQKTIVTEIIHRLKVNDYRFVIQKCGKKTRTQKKKNGVSNVVVNADKRMLTFADTSMRSIGTPDGVCILWQTTNDANEKVLAAESDVAGC